MFHYNFFSNVQSSNSLCPLTILFFLNWSPVNDATVLYEPNNFLSSYTLIVLLGSPRAPNTAIYSFENTVLSIDILTSLAFFLLSFNNSFVQGSLRFNVVSVFFIDILVGPAVGCFCAWNL